MEILHKMKIQNINSTYNRTQYQTVKKSNNSQPSFQHRKIYEEKFWDKDILHAIKHNKEIQKLEAYLEKKFAVLELTLHSHDYNVSKEHKKFSIKCIYDRKHNISGEETELIPASNKKTMLEFIEKFKAKNIIEHIEARERLHNMKKNSYNHTTASQTMPKDKKNKNFFIKLINKLTNI